MEKNDGQNSTSYWLASVEPLIFSPLVENIKTDVVIVGGGIAGLSVAYTLSKNGKRVVVLERDFIGSGETGNTTAHIVNALDDRYSVLEQMFDEDDVRLAAQSHTMAINYIERIILDEGIECDFKRLDGYLFLHPSDKIETLEEEYEASRRAGISTELIEHIPGIHLEQGPCLKFPNQATFHPLKYLHGLCRAIISHGGRIYTNTQVTEIDKKGVSVGSNFVHADHIVVATNTPINNVVTMHTKQFPYRTYVIGAKIPKDIINHALWWDTGEQDSVWHTQPYHYVRIQSLDDEHDLLIVGGEDHKTGQSGKENIAESERFNYLEGWARHRFPFMKEITYKWSGQVMEPIDALGFIGRNPGDDNIYIVTGDSGNGMTHAAIAGILIPDLIIAGENPWEKIYSPSRIPTKALGTYISEVGSMTAQYADYLTSGDLKSTTELPYDDGAILKISGKRVAVYKDPDGMIHAYSAVCPHLGCSVRWNSFEKTFDCPCHGSRFSHTGKVVNGPSNTDLKPIEVRDDKLITH